MKYSDISFYSIFLLDAQRGWAWVGAPAPRWSAPSADGDSKGPSRHGIMLTNDGGCHWHGLWNDKRQIALFGDIYFIDENDGWLAGGYEPGLYHTNDGGLTWQRLSLPAEQMKVKSVYFRDRDHGWLVTGEEELFETHDAGRTWRNVIRSELLAQLDELMIAWDRWPVGRLFGMLSRGGCFTAEQLEQRRRH